MTSYGKALPSLLKVLSVLVNNYNLGYLTKIFSNENISIIVLLKDTSYYIFQYDVAVFY